MMSLASTSDVPFWHNIDVHEDEDGVAVGTLYAVVGGNPISREIRRDSTDIESLLMERLHQHPIVGASVVGGADELQAIVGATSVAAMVKAAVLSAAMKQVGGNRRVAERLVHAGNFQTKYLNGTWKSRVAKTPSLSNQLKAGRINWARGKTGDKTLKWYIDQALKTYKPQKAAPKPAARTVAEMKKALKAGMSGAAMVVAKGDKRVAGRIGKAYNWQTKFLTADWKEVVRRSAPLRKTLTAKRLKWAKGKDGYKKLEQYIRQGFKAHSAEVKRLEAKIIRERKEKTRGWDLFKDVVTPVRDELNKLGVVRDLVKVAKDVIRSPIVRTIVETSADIPIVNIVGGPAKIALDWANHGLDAVEEVESYAEQLDQGFKAVEDISIQIQSGKVNLATLGKAVTTGTAALGKLDELLAGRTPNAVELKEIATLKAGVAKAKKLYAEQKGQIASATVEVNALKSTLSKAGTAKLKALEAKANAAKDEFSKVAAKGRYGSEDERAQAAKVAAVVKIAAEARAAVKARAEASQEALPGIFIDSRGKAKQGRFRKVVSAGGSGLVHRDGGTQFGKFLEVSTTPAQLARDKSAREQGLKSEAERRELAKVRRFLAAEKEYESASKLFSTAKDRVKRGLSDPSVLKRAAGYKVAAAQQAVLTKPPRPVSKMSPAQKAQAAATVQARAAAKSYAAAMKAKYAKAAPRKSALTRPSVGCDCTGIVGCDCDDDIISGCVGCDDMMSEIAGDCVGYDCIQL